MRNMAISCYTIVSYLMSLSQMGGSPPPRLRWWLKDLWGWSRISAWFRSRQGSNASASDNANGQDS